MRAALADTALAQDDDWSASRTVEVGARSTNGGAARHDARKRVRCALRFACPHWTENRRGSICVGRG